MFSKRTSIALLVACLTAGAQAQPLDTIFLQTTVGSFKILSAGETPASGRVEINFSGTVLLSDLVGIVTPVGAVRLEIDRPDRKKKVYFGKGKLIVEGKFRGLQFFGRDLNGKFTGNGILRLYGEFDKKLETGNYWYTSQPEKKPWGTGGLTITVPALVNGAAAVQGKVKKVGGK